MDNMTADQALEWLAKFGGTIRAMSEGRPLCFKQREADTFDEALSVARQALTAPRVPDKRPMPELMMSTWHENKGWNECVDYMRATAAPAPADSMQLGEHVADEVFFSAPGYSIEDRIIVPAGEAIKHVVGSKITRINKLYRHKLGEPAATAPDEPTCKHCGNPTMHVGDICYGCCQAPAPADPSGGYPALVRYGLQWNGPTAFVSTPMEDGYWTPWHVADLMLASAESRAREHQANALLDAADEIDRENAGRDITGVSIELYLRAKAARLRGGSNE